jgi:Phage integrase family
MNPLELQVENALQRAHSSEHLRHRRSKVLEYVKFCEVHFYQSFPVRFVPLSAFLAHHVNRNKGSTASVPSVISYIKTTSDRLNLPWLQQSELIRLADVRKVFAYDDSSPSRRKRAITADVLTRIASAVDFHHIFDYYFFMLFTLGHDGLFRLAELLSGLGTQDVEWLPNRTAIRLFLRRTKTVRSGAGIWVTIWDYDSPRSAVKLLARWYGLHSLWNQPTSVIFPRTTPTLSLDWSTTLSKDALRKAIKRAVDLAGLPAAHYSGHSLRGGGATDLFNMNVPYATIKKYGRWESDAALIYWRDEGEIARSAAHAFGQATRSAAQIWTGAPATKGNLRFPSGGL